MSYVCIHLFSQIFFLANDNFECERHQSADMGDPIIYIVKWIGCFSWDFKEVKLDFLKILYCTWYLLFEGEESYLFLLSRVKSQPQCIWLQYEGDQLIYQWSSAVHNHTLTFTCVPLKLLYTIENFRSMHWDSKFNIMSCVTHYLLLKETKKTHTQKTHDPNELWELLTKVNAETKVDILIAFFVVVLTGILDTIRHMLSFWDVIIRESCFTAILE